ncbi:MAG: bifunctional fucokinase/L-fucose-1-P-guanylyltransferase [Prevotella sp.]|nr:bifunctional fucokinase/L-fucose-1-P-guanylyltransferase [Prevotella sp.]
MKKLLSLPPNLVDCFHDVTGFSHEEYFCTNDPIGHKLGSGGGTTWLLQQAFQNEASLSSSSFEDWLCKEKRILIHAGGQSRRLPSYAPSGKVLTPIPVFRWERGQRIGQTLLDLQLPLYEQLMSMSPDSIHTMVVSGDVYIRTTQPLPPVPDADVVCYGLWLDASVARNHGVFVSSRRTPQVLKQMLQKPAVSTLKGLMKDHYYLTDIGVWLLSDRAVKLLSERSTSSSSSSLKEYDLYGEFGCSLGTEPVIEDAELKELTVAVVPLTGGEFYHYGTSHEMISSTLAVQNLVGDQRRIMHHDLKPHPSIFVQNAITKIKFTEENTNIWIENSYIGEHWQLTHDNIVTGVPQNDWHLTLQPGECIDVVPIGETEYCLRRYHIDDRFAGEEQQRKHFPVLSSIDHLPSDGEYPLLSAEDISNQANLRRLVAQRRMFQNDNLPTLARNWEHSVFYQLDLSDVAARFKDDGLTLPPPVSEEAPLLTRISDAMFRSDSDQAFALLREGLTETVLTEKQSPRKSVYDDQIVWGRSPVRIDLAGGWTDTPPYCLMEGGSVINIAIELNGQPPLQTYVKPCHEPHIVLRSIDLGAIEIIDTYEQLAQYNKVGSPFSIPKAALSLAGFLPEFSKERYSSLRAQLEAFGCGIELTLLSAIPAGSGLGTSSILASTVLGAVNDFCSLAWDKNEIGHRTLILEQLLTTGGGWQDQFGGVLGGVKLLQTQRGFNQSPIVRWLPDNIFTQAEYQPCHLLYYTGVTRTAKHILAEIVRRMFLNHHDQLLKLRQMKEHTMEMYEAIQRQDFLQTGRLIRRTWQQNQQIDNGTNPPAIEQLTRLIDDYCLGYKLPGAGGGGYLYMVAKDPEAAARIKQTLSDNRPNARARFVDMALSASGLQVSRS